MCVLHLKAARAGNGQWWIHGELVDSRGIVSSRMIIHYLCMYVCTKYVLYVYMKYRRIHFPKRPFPPILIHRGSGKGHEDHGTSGVIKHVTCMQCVLVTLK